MTVMKTELKRMLLEWDTKFMIINAKLNKENAEVSHPNTYLFESQDLNVTDKKNALDKYINVTLAQHLSTR